MRRAGAFALALAVLTGWDGAAMAQEAGANNAPPQERLAVSSGGVDMRSGRYAYDQSDLAIGGEGGALALARTLAQQVAGHTNPFGNFSHNWDVLVSEKRVSIHQNNFVHAPTHADYQIEVAFGGRSQSFRAYGATGYQFDLVSRAGYGMLSFVGDRAAGAVYTYTAGDGTIATFRAINSADCSTALRCAYVSQIAEPDGTVLSFHYDDPAGANNSVLRKVTSSRGYALLLEYSGLLVTKACVLNLAVQAAPSNNICPAGAQATASYGYTSHAGRTRLASATDPANAAWTFSYSGTSANLAMGFIRPGESAPWLTNTIWERPDSDGLIAEVVTEQSFADGSSFVYNYDFTPDVFCQDPAVVPSIAGGSYTDNLGQTTQVRYGFPYMPFDPSQGHGQMGECDGDDPPSPYVHQVTPGPVEVIDPLLRTTLVDYCDPNAMANLPTTSGSRCIVMPMPAAVTDPEGIRTEFQNEYLSRNVLQSRRIAKPGSGLPDIVTSATYNCTPATIRYCNKPLTVTDARGAVTTYVYDAAHGGVLTETGPAVNGVSPQTRHIYAQRQARRSDGSAAGLPIWLRTATSLCRTSAASPNGAHAPCSVAADEVLTQYDYGPDSGPNTLLLRGQTVTSTEIVNGSPVTTILRTCYGYDALGRRISETQPNANLASCS